MSRLHIKRFFVKYRPDKTDPANMVGEDWVEYGPIGSLDKSLTTIRVKDLKPREPIAQGNPSSEMGWMRWQIIEQAYLLWKSGNEAPIDGTPLAAWNALSPEQAEVLRSRGIRTVEDVAVLTDAHVERIPLPMRDLIKQARQFIDSADTRRTSAALAEKDREIDNLKAQSDEQKDTIKDLIAKVNQLAEVVAAQQEAAKPAKKKVA